MVKTKQTVAPVKNVGSSKGKKITTKIPHEIFNRKNLIQLSLILGLTLIAYFPSFTDGFTNWDDNAYITDNALVKNFTFVNFYTHFTQFYMGHYHPFTMISFMFDYLTGGNHPFIFHFINVLIHLFNTCLVFWFILLLTKNLNIALVTTILFGVHPLHVESVTWIAERKDVLFAFFYLLSLISYLYYIRLKKTKYILYSLVLFLFSLLSKAQATPLFAVVIAIDFLEKRKPVDLKLILEKSAFFILAIGFGYVSTLADKTNMWSEGMDKYPYIERIILASYALTLYFYKLIVPLHLSNWYPYPYVAGSQMPAWLWIFLIVPVFYLLAIVISYKKNHFVTFALLFFGFNIVTMLQLFPIRDASITDRYVYVPSIGLFLLAGIAFHFLVEKNRDSINTYRTAGIILVIVFAIITNLRASIWKSSETLWEDTLSKYPNIALARLNYGKAIYESTNDFNKTIIQYNAAISLDPKFAVAYNNRGVILDAHDEKIASIEDYKKAISLRKNYALAYSNMAMTKKDLEKFDEAIVDINKAIQITPDEAAYYRNRGLIRVAEKKYEQALKDFNLALHYDPKLSFAWSERGTAKHFLGDYTGAIKDYDKAISLNDTYAESYFDRAAAKMKLGDTYSACADLKKAADLGREDAKSIYEKNCH